MIKMKYGLKMMIASVLSAGVMGTINYAQAEENKPEAYVQTQQTAQTQSMMAGSKSSEKDKVIDTIIDYRNTNGAQITGEVFDKQWTAKPEEVVNIGLRSPKMLEDRIRLNGVVDFKQDFSTWGYTAFGEGFLGQNLLVRTGSMQNSAQIKGGFVGAKFQDTRYTIDADVWHDGEKMDAKGFVATMLGKVYLSAGGDFNQKYLTTLTGWIDQGKLGIFNKVVVDFNKEVQSGQLILADESTRDKAVFDFKQHVYSGSEMQGVVTGGVLNGWAPFDAYATERLALIVNWSNNKELVNIDVKGYWKPTTAFFFGVGPKVTYDKKKEEYKPALGLEIYATVPGTPLMSWADTSVDAKTGTMMSTVFVGGKGKF